MPTDTLDYLRLHLQTVPAFRALLRGIECRLFAQLGELEAPVLDVGCGDGHFASFAFKASPFAGFDLDRAMVREAASRQVYQHVLNADATELPFTRASFPTVVSNCVLEHIPDLENSLAEISRVICPAGRFAFSVPSHHFPTFLLGTTLLNYLGMPRLADGYGRWFNNHSRHYHLHTPEVWQQVLFTHGFEVISWQYYMTAAGHRVFDLLHYLGLPNLILRKLTGRWTFWNPFYTTLMECWLRPYYNESAPKQGAYLFFDCRKNSMPRP